MDLEAHEVRLAQPVDEDDAQGAIADRDRVGPITLPGLERQDTKAGVDRRTLDREVE